MVKAFLKSLLFGLIVFKNNVIKTEFVLIFPPERAVGVQTLFETPQRVCKDVLRISSPKMKKIISSQATTDDLKKKPFDISMPWENEGLFIGYNRGTLILNRLADLAVKYLNFLINDPSDKTSLENKFKEQKIQFKKNDLANISEDIQEFKKSSELLLVGNSHAGTIAIFFLEALKIAKWKASAKNNATVIEYKKNNFLSEGLEAHWENILPVQNIDVKTITLVTIGTPVSSDVNKVITNLSKDELLNKHIHFFSKGDSVAKADVLGFCSSRIQRLQQNFDNNCSKTVQTEVEIEYNGTKKQPGHLEFIYKITKQHVDSIINKKSLKLKLTIKLNKSESENFTKTDLSDFEISENQIHLPDFSWADKPRNKVWDLLAFSAIGWTSKKQLLWLKKKITRKKRKKSKTKKEIQTNKEDAQKDSSISPQI